jgi:hypothetical protein
VSRFDWLCDHGKGAGGDFTSLVTTFIACKVGGQRSAKLQWNKRVMPGTAIAAWLQQFTNRS